MISEIKEKIREIDRELKIWREELDADNILLSTYNEEIQDLKLERENLVSLLPIKDQRRFQWK